MENITREIRELKDELHKSNWKPYLGLGHRVYYVAVGVSVYWLIDHGMVIHTGSAIETVTDLMKALGGPAGIATMVGAFVVARNKKK